MVTVYIHGIYTPYIVYSLDCDLSFLLTLPLVFNYFHVMCIGYSHNILLISNM